MLTAHTATNMNFPAPLAVMGFLAACAGLFIAAASAAIAWFIRKPKFARVFALLVATGSAVYFSLLLGFSLASHSTALAPGQEKYFCEIDCHLAYSVVDVQTQSVSAGTRYVITLRTRFDETTTSPTRPKDAPLTPNARIVRLVDASGHEYPPTATAGTPLTTSLTPANSYTQLIFLLPQNATSPRLLITSDAPNS
jgi:hypothetical protein